MASGGSYLDYSGRDDVLSGGARMIPVHHAEGRRSASGPSGSATTRTCKVLLLHGGPGATHEYLEACDSFLPAGGHRVLLLRPARLRLQRPARRAGAVGARPLRRRGRAGPPGARARTADNFVLFGQSWGGILAIEYALRVPAAPARPGHLQHDGQRPGLQRLRRAGADAGDGPGGAGRDQGAGGQRRHREPALHGAADASSTTSSTCCGCPPTSGPTRSSAAFAHINPAIYVSDAGAERARHQRRRQARALGPHRRPGLDRGADPGHRRAPRHHGPGPHADDGRAAARTAATCTAPTAATWRMYDDQQTYFAGLTDFLLDLGK